MIDEKQRRGYFFYVNDFISTILGNMGHLMSGSGGIVPVSTHGIAD
jgi:hypothetical protein